MIFCHLLYQAAFESALAVAGPGLGAESMDNIDSSKYKEDTDRSTNVKTKKLCTSNR